MFILKIEIFDWKFITFEKRKTMNVSDLKLEIFRNYLKFIFCS